MVSESTFYGVVYKTTNLLNGKIYIGQTIQKGKQLETYLGSGVSLRNAIIKYGKDKFIKYIIFYAFDKNELDNAEEHLIEIYSAREKSIGYNIMKGASLDMTGLKHSDETKKKISDAGRGRRHTKQHKEWISNFNKGRVLSESTKQKIREKAIGRITSKETKIKLSQKGKVRSISKESIDRMIKSKLLSADSVMCLNTNKRWESLTLACDELGTKMTTEYYRLKNKKYNKTSLRYEKDLDDKVVNDI